MSVENEGDVHVFAVLLIRARSERGQVTREKTWFVYVTGALSSAAVALGAAGCGEASNDAPPEVAPPPWDSAAAPKTLKSGPDFPPLRSQGPLTMTVDTAATALVNAILYDDGGALRLAASAGNQLACDALEPAWGVHYISVAVDAGPKNNYWLGEVTAPALVARVPFDSQTARDIHASAVKVQLGTAAQASAFVGDGAVPAEITVTVESRRTLGQPGNKPANTLNIAGSVSATVCPSAAELLSKATRKRAEPPTEWVHFEVGDRKVEVKTVLAFSADDTKNGHGITGFGFYEAAGARCDDATRPLHDNGGGINGLQVEVGGVAIPASRPAWGFTQPVSFDVTDVTAGRGAFAQVILAPPTATGHLHVGEVEYKVDPNKDEAGAIYGWIRGSRETGTRVLVEGRFTAKICRK